MNLLFFIIKRRILHLSTGINIKISIKILGIGFIILFGMITGYGIDVIIDDENIKLNYDSLILWLILIISGFSVFAEFFPSYKSISDVVIKIYPINSSKKWFINLAYYFFQFKNIAILTFISIVAIFSVRYSLSDFIKSIVIFLISFLSVQSLKRIIDYKQNHRYHKYYWISSNFIPIYIVYMYGFESDKTTITLITFLIIHIFISYLIDDSTIDVSSSSHPLNSTFLNNTLRNANYLAFLKNSKSKSAFLIQLIFKVSFLPLFQFELFQLFSNDFLLFQFISPISIY